MNANRIHLYLYCIHFGIRIPYVSCMHRRMYPSCITVIHAGYLQDTSTIRIPLASFVRYVHDTCIYDMSYLPTTGVPKLAHLQRKMKTLKAGKTSGIQVTSLLELKQFMTPLLMPPSISAACVSMCHKCRRALYAHNACVCVLHVCTLHGFVPSLHACHLCTDRKQ